MIIDDITELIGETPLLRLDPDRHGLPGVDLYAKLESANPFGSVKDRIAWNMIKDDLDRLGREGRTLVEASSGNTAKALVAIAGRSGIPVRAYTNRIKVDGVRDLLMLLGAEIEELPGLSECPDPTAPNDVFSMIDNLVAAAPGDFHHTSQYTNPDNLAAHFHGTGREIDRDLGPVDYLFGGLGTTGSTRGTAEYLLRRNPSLRAVGVVSTPQDFIPGIRSAAELWEVGLFRPDFYTEIVPVDSHAAIDGALELARSHGVLAGPTSGATYRAAQDHLRQRTETGQRLTAVIIVCDRLEPYLPYLKQRRPDLFGSRAIPSPRDVTAEEAATSPQLTATELAALSDDPSVLRVDTRGAMAYRIGHVPGSINIRDDQLDAMFTQGCPFPTTARLVFICPVGEYSRRAAAHARRAGLDASSLAGGVLGWRDAGMSLERGKAAADRAT